jgi:cardiolipin synthase (CMP-forming)
MYLSDLLDGFIARRYGQVSELGKIIDPLADKISVITISIVLLLLGLIPLWFVLIIIIRDLMILVFGLYLHAKKNIHPMSNFAGKAAVFTIGLILLFAIADYELLKQINNYLYYVAIFLIIYSLYLYYSNFKKLIGG